MLRHDFGLPAWDAPLDRLCPPVANRLNYICWLTDLMKLSSPPSSSPVPTPTPTPTSPLSAENTVAPDDGGGDRGEDNGGGDPEGGTAAMSTAERNLLLFGSAAGAGGGGEEDGMVVSDDDGDGAAAAAQKTRVCRGIDVGTGASCIYPLLGAKVAGWSFLATEIDAVSAEWAEKNARANGLQVRACVRACVCTEINTTKREN